MLTKEQRNAEARKPIGRMIERMARRIVEPCLHRCFTCERFIGNGERACPGAKGGKNRDATPLCHVDFRTGRKEAVA